VKAQTSLKQIAHPLQPKWVNPLFSLAYFMAGKGSLVTSSIDYKKYELMLTGRAKAYSSSGSVV